MYARVRIKDVIRVEPKLLGLPLKEALVRAIKESYDLKLDKRSGLQFISLIEITNIGEKTILPNDGAVYVDVEFEYLAYKPFLGETVEGVVNTITPMGAYVNLGYFDGFLHKSQIFNDVVEYNANSKALVGKNSGNSLKAGDKVRARIATIGFMKKEGLDFFKLGLTMRQPGLGKI
jgi:DNA-directed RNA polymerase subunit E'